MIEKTVKVVNEQGMHMRPAGILAKFVKEYPSCSVTLEANGKVVKANSPMQIMSACIKKDCAVKIVCDGADEDKLADEIVKLFESGFGE